MSWIQDNKVPAAILGVTGAGVLGLGVMLFNAWSAATEAQETFDSINSSLANLNSANIAPTPENLAAKHAMVKEYIDSAGEMALVLYKLQPDPKPLSDTDFQAKVKARTLEVKKLGAGRLPADFNLTFDKYVDNLPKASGKLTADQVATAVMKIRNQFGIQEISLFNMQRNLIFTSEAKPKKYLPPPTADVVQEAFNKKGITFIIPNLFYGK